MYLDTEWCEYTCSSNTYLAVMSARSTLIQKTPSPQLSTREYIQYMLRGAKAKPDYLLGRILVKHLLVRHLDIHWHDLSVLHDVNGAPNVWVEDEKLPVTVSISHSHEWVACVLNVVGHRVGVDIEQIRPRKVMLEMARYLAHQQEMGWVNQHCSSTEDFYRYWTAKEALAKAHRLPLISEGLRQYVIQMQEMQDQLPWLVSDGTLIQHFKLPNDTHMGAWAFNTQYNAFDT